ncbi:MAG: AI-2E family transporter, partial [Candidatus Moranbacteria bacterium]|nr:AI-2E family transporter [Candidatus Moranbacteria bacterium]
MIEKRQVEISMGVVFRTAMLAIAIWFLYMIREILALLFMAILIVTAIDPVVDYLQRKKVPRTLGVLVVYVLLSLVIGLSISFLVPPLISQSKDFIEKIPAYLQSAGSYPGIASDYFQSHNMVLNVQQIADNFNNGISNLPQQIFSGTIDLVGNFISIIVVLVM